MAMKRCPKCGEYKHRNAFWRNKSNASGLQSLCKWCLKSHLKQARKDASNRHEQKTERKVRRKLRARWRAHKAKYPDSTTNAVLARSFKKKWNYNPPRDTDGKLL